MGGCPAVSRSFSIVTKLQHCELVYFCAVTKSLVRHNRMREKRLQGRNLRYLHRLAGTALSLYLSSDRFTRTRSVAFQVQCFGKPGVIVSVTARLGTMNASFGEANTFSPAKHETRRHSMVSQLKPDDGFHHCDRKLEPVGCAWSYSCHEWPTPPRKALTSWPHSRFAAALLDSFPLVTNADQNHDDFDTTLHHEVSNV